MRRNRGRNFQTTAANKHWRRKKTTKHNNDCLNTEREKMPLRNPQGHAETWTTQSEESSSRYIMQIYFWSGDSIWHAGKFTTMIALHSHLQPQYKYELFHIYFSSFHCTGRYEINKLTSLPMCGFIAKLVEHLTGIKAEVTGSNPVEALIFFRLLLSNCLNWKIYCDDHSSISIFFLVYTGSRLLAYLQFGFH